jgi:hypothetical protein
VTRRRWVLVAAAVLVAGVCGVVAMSGADHPAAAARAPAANTEKVEQGELSALVSGAGTLTYRARSDGSPYAVVNPAGGVYTQLPDAGDNVGCGGVRYGWTTARWCCCAARSRPTELCTWASGARTCASSTATCTSSATTPTPTSASTPPTAPSLRRPNRRSGCCSARRALA